MQSTQVKPTNMTLPAQSAIRSRRNSSQPAGVSRVIGATPVLSKAQWRERDEQTQNGFAFSRAQFEDLVDGALKHAKKLGASAAAADASEGVGLSVGVRKGELETVERNRDKGLGITVYIGKRRGNASTSDFSPGAVRQTVQAAYDIARFTAQDDAAGLPDAQDVCSPDEARREGE